MVTMGMRVNTIKNDRDGRIYIDLNDLIAALALEPGFIVKETLVRRLNDIGDQAKRRLQ